MYKTFKEYFSYFVSEKAFLIGAFKDYEIC